MRLVCVQAPDSVQFPGVVVGNDIYDLSSICADIPGFLSDQERLTPIARNLIAASEPTAQLDTASFCAPVPRPGKFICIGLNYRDHAIESGMEIPEIPTVFTKYDNAVCGCCEPIVLPAASSQVDYEAELAFVIKKEAKHVKASDWREYVGGYTCVNDVSARDFQLATSQWTIGKTFDTFGPMGPCLVTEDEIEDPGKLRIWLDLNGEIMQDSNTEQLVFGIPELLEYLSAVMTLNPGDVVSTGTPPGVGMARKPPVYLKPGDVCKVGIEGVGVLVNECVAEGA